jgi:hypothetical protein
MTDFYLEKSRSIPPRTGQTRRKLRGVAKVSGQPKSPEVRAMNEVKADKPLRYTKAEIRSHRRKAAMAAGLLAGASFLGVKELTTHAAAEKAKAPQPITQTYEVKPGDTKSGLVDKYVSAEKIKQHGNNFYQNEIIDQSDPELLQAGEQVTLVDDVAKGYIKYQQEHPSYSHPNPETQK